MSFPTDPVFLLRPFTVDYAGLLSLSRYPAGGDVPSIYIAIQSFFGNPLLFYGHENLFDQKIGSFNGFADYVNHIQPNTRWTSLGEIARHSHLLRRRDDGGFDIRMFSNEMDLQNPTGADTTFYIQRRGDLLDSKLTIDGAPTSFERDANVSTLRIIIPSHQIRKLRIEYRNDVDPSREDVRKTNVYAYALRLVSDFRDLHFSRSSWGNALTRAYYHHDWDSIELYLEEKWWVGICFVGMLFLGLRYRRKKKLARTAERAIQKTINCP